MSQTSYGLYQAAGLLGMLANSGFKHTESMIAREAIPIGRGVLQSGVDHVQLPSPNQAVLAFNGDFVDENVVTITVNGEDAALTADIATTHADHDAFMTALLAQIQALSTVSSARLATSSEDANNRSFYIFVKDGPAVVSETVTGGTSQPTGTSTPSVVTSDFYGLAQHTAALEGGLPNTDTTPSYKAKDPVNVLRRGSLYVWFETAFDPQIDTLYVRHEANGTGKEVGQFRNDSDSSKATDISSLPVKVKSKLTSAGIGVIELNLP